MERLLQRQSLTPMTHLFARIASSAALAALVTGCAVVPGDPYYTPQPSGYGVYEQPAYIYGSPPPAYGDPVAPPPGYYGRGYDDRNAWRERERAQREREAQLLQQYAPQALQRTAAAPAEPRLPEPPSATGTPA